MFYLVSSCFTPRRDKYLCKRPYTIDIKVSDFKSFYFIYSNNEYTFSE